MLEFERKPLLHTRYEVIEKSTSPTSTARKSDDDRAKYAEFLRCVLLIISFKRQLKEDVECNLTGSSVPTKIVNIGAPLVRRSDF